MGRLTWLGTQFHDFEPQTGKIHIWSFFGLVNCSESVTDTAVCNSVVPACFSLLRGL